MIRKTLGKQIRWLVVFGLFVSVANAQVTDASATPPKTQKKSKKQRPAFAAVEEDPSLPRVLLLGDSISIGYTLPLRKQLEGKANLIRPPVNCQYSKFGVGNVEKWLGEKPWDVIHFNFGLHDIKHVVEGAKIVALGTEGSHRLETEARYEANLRELVAKLKKTDATLIWCSTTPVPEGAKGRIPGDEVRYNEIARRVMEDNKIEINDLYKMATPRIGEIQRKADVHFLPAGSAELATMLLPKIIEAIDSREATAK